LTTGTGIRVALGTALLACTASEIDEEKDRHDDCNRNGQQNENDQPMPE